MSSFGSSVINKSTKKLAPKVPSRRRTDALSSSTPQTSVQASASSSVETHLRLPEHPSEVPAEPASNDIPSVSQASRQATPSVDSRTSKHAHTIVHQANDHHTQSTKTTVPLALQPTQDNTRQPVANAQAEGEQSQDKRNTTDPVAGTQANRTGLIPPGGQPESRNPADAIGEPPERSPARRGPEDSEQTSHIKANASSDVVVRNGPFEADQQRTENFSGVAQIEQRSGAGSTDGSAEPGKPSAAAPKDRKRGAVGDVVSNAAKRRKVTQEASDTAQTKPRQPAKGKNATIERAVPTAAPKSLETAPDGDVGEQIAAVSTSASAPPRRPRPSRKGAVVELANTTQEEDGAGLSSTRGRTARISRKKAGTQTREPLPETEGTIVSSAKGTASKRATKRKPVRKKKVQQGETEASGQHDGDEAAGSDVAEVPKRRRARRREPTPEDAENVEIRPSETRISDLIKDPRTGKRSKLGERIQNIDWAEIVRKRNERMVNGEAEDAEGEDTVSERLARADREREAASQRGPQLRLVNGQMVVDTASLVVDRHAEAARNEAPLEEVEEDDFSRPPINSQTWIYNNRKDPAERTHAGHKSDPWTEELTDQFYEALRMFGTDFFIISKMFPGKTRRHIKLKFVREERANAARINAALIGDVVPMDFETYREATGKGADFYKDPKTLEQELDAEKEQHTAEIARQKEAAAELLRQKKADNATGADSSAKENEGETGTKGNKKPAGRKKKKQDQPRNGEEIEVLGTIED